MLDGHTTVTASDTTDDKARCQKHPHGPESSSTLRRKHTRAGETPASLEICMSSHVPGGSVESRKHALMLRGPASPTANICKNWPRKTPGSALQKNNNEKEAGALDCAVRDKKHHSSQAFPSSLADKAHFPFITLYHKHKSTGM